MELFA